MTWVHFLSSPRGSYNDPRLPLTFLFYHWTIGWSQKYIVRFGSNPLAKILSQPSLSCCLCQYLPTWNLHLKQMENYYTAPLCCWPDFYPIFCKNNRINKSLKKYYIIKTLIHFSVSLEDNSVRVSPGGSSQVS